MTNFKQISTVTNFLFKSMFSQMFNSLSNVKNGKRRVPTFFIILYFFLVIIMYNLINVWNNGSTEGVVQSEYSIGLFMFSGLITFVTVVLFFIVKNVTSDKNKYINLTTYLPVSKKVINYSMNLAELIIVFITLVILFSSFVVAYIFVNGFANVLDMLVINVYHAMLIYLVLQLIYKFIEFLLMKAKLFNYKDFIMSITVLVVLTITGKLVLDYLINLLVLDSLNVFPPINIFNFTLFISDKTSFLFTSGLFVIVSALILFLLSFIQNHEYVKYDYMKITKYKPTVFRTYFLLICRHKSNFLKIINIYIVMLFIIYFTNSAIATYGIYVLLLLSTIIIQVINYGKNVTTTLRDVNYKPTSNYFNMLFSAISYYFVATFPIQIFYVVYTGDTNNLIIANLLTIFVMVLLLLNNLIINIATPKFKTTFKTLILCFELFAIYYLFEYLSILSLFILVIVFIIISIKCFKTYRHNL